MSVLYEIHRLKTFSNCQVMKTLEREGIKNALHATGNLTNIIWQTGSRHFGSLPMCQPCKVVDEKALQRIAA
ncbi:hypothetical protein PCAR4_20019 [Paraburkholderia caribensis]|nr:hypothetical protein PCAR4_20019 [Paraburkholderia caribensis]